MDWLRKDERVEVIAGEYDGKRGKITKVISNDRYLVSLNGGFTVELPRRSLKRLD